MDSDTTRIKCGRFFILGAVSAFPGTMTSSGLGMALLAERDLYMGCAPLIERFFLAEEGRGVVIPEVGSGELVFLARLCWGLVGEGGGRGVAVADCGDGTRKSSDSVRAMGGI